LFKKYYIVYYTFIDYIFLLNYFIISDFNLKYISFEYFFFIYIVVCLKLVEYKQKKILKMINHLEISLILLNNEILL